MTRPFTSRALICIALVLLLTCTGTVSASVPQITGISPSGGPITGGTVVTITGSGFTGATHVRFGGGSGSVLTVFDDSRLTIITPPNPAGTAEVSVTGPNGENSSWSASAVYQYEEVPFPRIAGVSPSSGPASGSTTVIITGSGFYGVDSVRFGGKPGWSLRVLDDSRLTVMTPASSPGTVAISIKNAAGAGYPEGSNAMYTYEFPNPGLTGISPASGSTRGGTVVTITGSGFSGATDVRFGGISGTGMKVTDDSRLTVISPPNPAGTVGISVINPAHAGNSAGSATVFRYDIPVPKLTGISPSSGPAEGGTAVTLTGSGFTGTKDVRFGEKSVTGLNVTDDSHMTLITPAHAPGSVPIAITNTVGEGGSLGPATLFRYVNAPATTTAATTTVTPARGHSGDAGPAVSFPATSPAPDTPAATAAPGTTNAPGFEAVAGLSALCAIILLRKTPS